MLLRWAMPDGFEGGLRYDTPEMKSLFRHLDVCQDLGIHVMLTDWGIERNWNTVEGIQGPDDPRYAESIATYMDELVPRCRSSPVRL